MEVHVFRGKDRVFAFTNDESGNILPADYGPWIPFKKMEMARGEEPKAAVKTDECLDDIENHGFHITDTHVRITGSVIREAQAKVQES